MVSNSHLPVSSVLVLRISCCLAQNVSGDSQLIIWSSSWFIIRPWLSVAINDYHDAKVLVFYLPLWQISMAVTLPLISNTCVLVAWERALLDQSQINTFRIQIIHVIVRYRYIERCLLTLNCVDNIIDLLLTQRPQESPGHF